jgi:hypothetical protein
LVNKSSNTKNQKKPGFLCKRINPQQPYPPTEIRLIQIPRPREKPGFHLKSMIIVLSDGKTGFFEDFRNQVSPPW